MKLKSIFASLVMTAALFSSCDRDVNDWEVATGENLSLIHISEPTRPY